MLFLSIMNSILNRFKLIVLSWDLIYIHTYLYCSKIIKKIQSYIF